MTTAIAASTSAPAKRYGRALDAGTVGAVAGWVVADKLTGVPLTSVMVSLAFENKLPADDCTVLVDGVSGEALALCGSWVVLS